MTVTLAPVTRKRLAIIGGGSSGLISLKYAVDALPDWDIVCFERTNSNVGCWGCPYPGFVSTSTRYTTQFACYPVANAEVNASGQKTFEEFFREDEYGRYLSDFVKQFGLDKYICLQTEVERLSRLPTGQWQLALRRSGDPSSAAVPTQLDQQLFDALILCTGLAARAKDSASPLPKVTAADLHGAHGLSHITHRRIVVLGGGESAVDYAVRLSRPELQNKVFLSLASGIRVSPRYHPIRGVPSDFLRNRLMLSIHEDMRNWIGQRFVEARIQYQELFERVFPSRNRGRGAWQTPDPSLLERQKYWAYLLTKRAKDQLFNMFHNKSDGFLEAVARGEIQIVGQPLDDAFQKCRLFDTDGTVDVQADLLVPAIGYRSTLDTLCDAKLSVRDFYLGCIHTQYNNLFLVGFARPIIGNIPTISEMQARTIAGLLAGSVARPAQIEQLHARDAERLAVQFPKLNLDAIYPVEMFPYCDQLSRWLAAYPSLSVAGSFRNWAVMQLAPATTMHYFLSDQERRRSLAGTQIYMPKLLIALLLMLKPIDWLYRLLRWRKDGRQ